MKRKGLLVTCLVMVLLLSLMGACAKPAPAPAPVPAPAPTVAPAPVPVPAPSLGKPTYHYKWRMSAGWPEEIEGSQSIIRWLGKIRDRTEGRVDIKHYFSAVLGSWDATNEMLIRGDIETLFETLDDSYDPRLAIGYYIPYVMKTYEEAEKAWAPGGVVYEILNDVTASLGYRVLGAFNAGLSGVTLKNRPPSPGDPDVKKNMKIRVMALTACRLTYERLGYMTTAIPWGEVYTSLQTGIVDGQMGGGAQQACMLKDVQKYYVHYCDFIEPQWFSVNEACFQSLDPIDQKVMIDVSQEEQRMQFQRVKEMDEKFMKEFRDYGNEVILLTPAELDKCAAAVRKDVWPKLEPLIGKALIYRMCDELGIPRPVK